MKNIILLIVLIFSSFLVNAQRIVGYYPDYRASVYTQVRYDNLTHLIYAFLNPDASANLVTSGVWFNTGNFNNVKTRAILINPNIKIIIATGGAGEPNLPTVIASASLRLKFANNLIAFVVANNLDGVDIDYEFPITTTQKNNHELFLKMMKFKIDSLEMKVCRELELSVAVGGETNHTYSNPTHTDYFNTTAIPYIDIFNIMSYDANMSSHVYSNHSPYAFAVEAINGWNAYGVPYNKMTLGVPFYTNNGGNTYSAVNSSNTATAYNTDSYLGWQYNGCPTLKLKVDFAKSKNLAGIMIWEVGQDLYSPTSFSLLSNCLYPYIISTWGTFILPINPCTTLALDLDDLNNNHTNTNVEEINNYDLFVYDITGKYLTSYFYNGTYTNALKYTSNNLNNGLYILRISNNKTLTSEKLLITDK